MGTGFRLNDVAFFGRGIEEYVNMFNLDLNQMRGTSVLDCPAGPSSFARQASEHGISVTACDPMYEHDDVQELRKIVDRDMRSIAEKIRSNKQAFNDSRMETTERRRYMELFLEDYPKSKQSGRYLVGKLPNLPMADKSFDMVLSGNFLFAYADIKYGGIMENSPFDFQFHKEAVLEMIRLCRKEIRIYPLQGPAVDEHSYLRPLMDHCLSIGWQTALQPVLHKGMIGARTMLVISQPT